MIMAVILLMPLDTQHPEYMANAIIIVTHTASISSIKFIYIINILNLHIIFDHTFYESRNPGTLLNIAQWPRSSSEIQFEYIKSLVYQHTMLRENREREMCCAKKQIAFSFFDFEKCFYHPAI